MALGPRYDLGLGVLLLVLTAALLAVFGPGVLSAPWSALAVALFIVAALLSVAASRRPETTVGGLRVDYLTLRGLSSVAVGTVLLLTGGSDLLHGDPFFGAVALLGGLFPVVIGLGSLLRKEWAVPELREA